MSRAFQVETGQLRGAAGVVDGCRRQVEAGRKAEAAALVGSGMVGFAVVGACEAAGELSDTAFAGVARSWTEWARAAAAGAVQYDLADVDSASLVRAAGSDLVV